MIRALAIGSLPQLATVSLIQTIWWVQAPLLVRAAPVWLPLLLGAVLSPVKTFAQQRLRRALRGAAFERCASQALARPKHAMPESDAEAAFWSAHIAEYALSTSVPLGVAAFSTLVVALVILAGELGALVTLGLFAVFAVAALAAIAATRVFSSRASAAIDARRRVAVWLAAALRGGSEVRSRAAHHAYLSHVRGAVHDWCAAEDGFELRRNGARIAIVIATLALALLLLQSTAAALSLDLSRNLASTVAIGAGLSAGYAALRVLSDLWVTSAELQRLDEVLRAATPQRPPPTRALRGLPVALTANHLELRYGSHVAVHIDTMNAPLSGPLLITGPNGAGKSTLAAAIAGLHMPAVGTISMIEADGNGVPCAEVAREHVAFVPQTPVLIDALSIRENMALVVPTLDDALLRQELARLGMTPDLDDLVGTLSRGQQQRIGLARALLSDPRVLVLDEPDAWLDAASRDSLIAVLAAEGRRRVVVVVSHRTELQPIARSVIRVAADHTVTVDTRPRS